MKRNGFAGEEEGFSYSLLEEAQEVSVQEGLMMAGRLKEKRNQIWFTRENPMLKPLEEQLRKQNRRVLVLWGLSLAEETAGEIKTRCPADERPLRAVEAGRLWAAGLIRMPMAKRAILDCHAMAKETDPVSALLCHAVGQGISIIHTPAHALGLPMYELTALALKAGFENCQRDVEERLRIYRQRLEACIREEKEYTGSWASFLRQEKRREEGN